MSKFVFKNVGESVNDVVNNRKYSNKTEEKINNRPIGILLPLKKGYRKNESLFKMSFNINEQIKNNFKNFLMISKGEMIGNPSFGTRLNTIINLTNVDLEQIESIILSEIETGISKYFVNSMSGENTISVQNIKAEKVKSNEDLEDYVKIDLDFTILNSNVIENLILNFKINK